MQATNPQKLKQNCIIFLYYQTTGRRGMSTPGVKVWQGRMPLKQKYLIFFCHPTNRNLFH